MEMNTKKPIRPINILDIEKVLILDESSPSGLRWHRKYGGYRGQPAGHLNELGYWTVRVSKRLYYAHRLVAALSTGKDPGNVQVRR